MFSWPVFKQAMRSNWKLLLIFTTVLCAYLAMVSAFFTPQMFSEMGNMMQNMGPMTNLFGEMNSLNSFMAQAYYGMIAVMFPMVYCIIVGNKLIAMQVDRGAMAYWLSTPTTRGKITRTNALYFVLSLLAMYGFVTCFGAMACAAFQPGELDMRNFLWLNLGCFLLMFAISGICFAASCTFNLSRTSLAFGAGFPLAFLLIKMVSELSEDLSFFKYLTLNTLFDPEAIVQGGGFFWQFAILAAVGIVLYIMGMIIFREKDLPI